MSPVVSAPRIVPLAGTRALVTGSVQGLGLTVARRFAASGCRIVLHGLADDDAASSLRQDLEATYRTEVLYSGADLRHPAQIDRLMADAVEAFGGIDILVNNAVVRHTAPADAFSPRDWDEAIAVNLSAAFHTIRLALPGMKARNWGRIINVSSIYGLIGTPDRVGYVTTKTALIGLTRAVALETAGYGITCNAVCPGTARTSVHDAALRAQMAAEGLSPAEAEARLLAGKQPTGRLIDTEGIAALMTFLCGPDAADITGAALPIDGGWSAR
jgi:3-hydroxybutyrate dehydrogenase